VAPCRAVIGIHFDGDVHRTHLVGQFLVRIRFRLLKLVEYSSDIPRLGRLAPVAMNQDYRDDISLIIRSVGSKQLGVSRARGQQANGKGGNKDTFSFNFPLCCKGPFSDAYGGADALHRTPAPV
jgi:hypothetical protein